MTDPTHDLTDIQTMEAVLGCSGLSLRDLVESLPFMVCVGSIESHMEYFNKRWAQYTGVPAERLLGDGWVEIIHPDDRRKVTIPADVLASATEAVVINFRLRRADGQFRWMEAQVSPIRNASGAFVKWFSATTDVHEAYEMRQTLAANEERLRLVTLATQDIIFDWDVLSGIVRCNEHATALVGSLPVDRADLRAWGNFIHPDDRRRVLRSGLRAARAHASIWAEDFRIRRLDGTYAYVADHAHLVYDGRQLTRVVGALSDITAYREIERSLEEARARLESALEVGGMATWVWEFGSRKVIWDDASYKLFGMERTGLTATAIDVDVLFGRVHPDDIGRITKVFEDSMKSGTPGSGEFRVIHPDGGIRWIQTTALLERDVEGRPQRMAGVYVDITERRREEEARLRSQKMEALGTLAGGIAHDFNNILLAMAGNAKLAREEIEGVLPDTHPARRNLSEIEKAGSRAADLVRRILAFSRQQEAKREPVRLRPLIEEALRLVQPMLRANIEVATRLEDVTAVAADPIEIQQVVMNLLTNAAHAIGDRRGRIDIRLGTLIVTSGADAPCDAPDLHVGRYAWLQVRDSGCGIEPAIAERIFDPFFTTKPAGEGTGLGLAVVHGIVKSQGGAIGVQSEPNRGSTFNVYFPEAVVTADTVVAAAAAAPVRARGEQVLYVDDEEALVYLMSRVLERLGYRVTGCVDPHHALAELRAHPDAFDALVTDLSMSGMNGFELTRAARKIRPDIPVLLTSGYLRTQDRETAASLGIREIILKPNTVEELGHAVHRVLSELSSTAVAT